MVTAAAKAKTNKAVLLLKVLLTVRIKSAQHQDSVFNNIYYNLFYLSAAYTKLDYCLYVTF